MGVRLLAAQRAISRPGLVERKVCFISGTGNWCVRVADICPKADSLPLPPKKQEVRAFLDRVTGWGGYIQKQHSHLQ